MKLRPPAEPKYGTLIWDVETDGLLPSMTRIHVLCIREYETGLTWTFRRNKREDTIAKGVAMLANARCVVGHNIAGFDLPALELIFPDFMLHPDCIVQDTLVIVRVIYADQKDKDYRLWERGKLPGNLIGSMQLEAWGHRLRLQKGDYKKEMEAKAKELGIIDPEEISRYVWGTWNREMEEYCELDVDVTTALWRKIEEEDYPAGPLDFEHDAHQMAILIEENGWPFDIRRAEKLADDIEDEMEELAKKAETHYGFWFSPDKKKIVKPQWEDPDGKNAKKKYEEPVAEYGEDYSRAVWGRVVEAKTTRKFKAIWRINPKTGERSINNNVDEGALYCPVKIKDFKPTSRHHIIDRFTTVHDWVPNEFTDTGQPSVNDDVLRGLVGKIPMAQELAEIFYLAKRLGQIATGKESWLNHVAEDGAIHHRLNVGGTISGRCAHSNPNIAQVPKVVAVPAFNKDGSFNSKAFDENGVAMPWAIPSYKDGKPKGAILTGREGKHGYDCRRLFYVPKGWRLVGCDLSGIELRCLANLTAPHDGGFLINQILEGDIHEVNRQAAGLDSRDKAKTFIYACVPMDTKALTISGWKTYDELEVGELVLTYNDSKNIKEWKPVLEKVKYKNAEVVRKYNNTGFDVRSTPNHRWFIRQRRVKGSGRYFTNEVRTTEELNTESNIITNAPYSDVSTLSGFSIPVFNDVTKRETDWVSEVLKMSMTEMQAFLAGFMVADGYYQIKSKNSGGWNWNQNEGNIQEAALLATYLCNAGYIHVSRRTDTCNPMKVVHIGSKQHVTCQTMQEEVLENQDVWCIRTENESWVMRQGDCITITGNTIYGAGFAKIGSIVDPLASVEEQILIGKRLLEQFYAKLPGLGVVVKNMKKQAKRGWIEGIDGRRLLVRAMHAALNLRLQSDGAMIAKKWMLTSDDLFQAQGWKHGWDGDYAFLAFVHDELQVAVREELTEYAKEILIDAAAMAGEFFNFAMKVDAEAKDGINWAMTH